MQRPLRTMVMACHPATKWIVPGACGLCGPHGLVQAGMVAVAVADWPSPCRQRGCGRCRVMGQQWRNGAQAPVALAWQEAPLHPALALSAFTSQALQHCRPTSPCLVYKHPVCNVALQPCPALTAAVVTNTVRLHCTSLPRQSEGLTSEDRATWF